MVGLNLEDADVAKEVEAYYKDLQAQGFEVLYDDRLLRAGEKFTDADLMGIPVRLTLSKRTLKEAKVEFKFRKEQALPALF